MASYFSRQEFVANAEVAEQARQAASEAVRVARAYHGVELDGSPGSISELQMVLDRVRNEVSGADASVVERFAQIFGAYLGETLRAELTGDWGSLRLYTHFTAAVRLGSSETVITPESEVRGRLTGENTASLLDYCRVVRQAAGQPAPSPPPRPERLYPLAPGQGYFDAGVLADGRQALMSFFWTGLTAVFFAPGGSLLGHEVRPLPVEPELHPRTGMQLHNDAFDEAVQAALSAWKTELGFEDHAIQVRRFEIDELGVGIEDYPDHLAEFIAAPELAEPDEDARAEALESIRAWDEDGSFVLYWGNDLWLDGEGEVTSS